MPALHEIWEFHPFRVEVRERRLLRDGVDLPLTPKAFDTLIVLLRRHGEVVPKQELKDAVWGSTYVEEAVLTQNIYTLRRALEDQASKRRMIVTVPRIGYRFAATVRGLHLSSSRDPSVPRSIAVLPFEALGHDEELRILGLGLADGLTTRLSGLRGLTVRPTSSVLALGERPVDSTRLGAMLGVEGAVEGRVRRVGNSVRVTAQLVELQSRGTIWGAQYDEPWSDLFMVQDRIAEKLAQALRLELTTAERARLRLGTSDATAYGHYLKGRFFWSQRSRVALLRAIEQFEKSAAADSNWALPHVGLADCYVLLPLYADMKPRDSFAAARREATLALKAEPDLAEAVTVLAYTRFVHDREWEDAEKGLRHALELSPNYATAHHWYAFLLAALSRFDEAVIHASRAIDLDPPSLVNNADLGWVLYFARQYDEAVEQFGVTLELDNRFSYARLGLALTHIQQGKRVEAEREARRAAEDGQGVSVAKSVLIHILGQVNPGAEARQLMAELVDSKSTPSSRLSLAWVGLGENEKALDALERAVEERSRFAVFAAVWPAFDSLRLMPRFGRLLEQMGLDSFG